MPSVIGAKLLLYIGLTTKKFFLPRARTMVVRLEEEKTGEKNGCRCKRETEEINACRFSWEEAKSENEEFQNWEGAKTSFLGSKKAKRACQPSTFWIIGRLLSPPLPFAAESFPDPLSMVPLPPGVCTYTSGDPGGGTWLTVGPREAYTAQTSLRQPLWPHASRPKLLQSEKHTRAAGLRRFISLRK